MGLCKYVTVKKWVHPLYIYIYTILFLATLILQFYFLLKNINAIDFSYR